MERGEQPIGGRVRLPSCLTVGLAVAALALPATAAAIVRPVGPTLRTPTAHARVRSSSIVFRWRPQPGVPGYDLRIARNGAFSRSMRTIPSHRPRVRLLLGRGTWYWKVRSHGHIASSWSTTRAVAIAPSSDILPPTPPTALKVTTVGETTVGIAFGKSSDEFGVTGYRILANGRAVATTRTTSATVARLSCAIVYTLTVVAFDAAGNLSRPSPPAHARTHPCSDTAPPTAPTALTAVSVSDTTVALAWPDASDPDGRVAGYVVSRDGVQLGQPTGAGFLATHLAPATSYVFSVRARDGSGHLSAPSDPLTVTTARPLPATGPVYAYMLASTSSSFLDFERNYMRVGTVSPTYFHVAGDGSLVGSDDPLLSGFARLHGVHLEPRVESQDPTALHAVLADPDRRAALVASIARLAASYGYDGINIDFEAGAATDRASLTAFVAALATALHSQGETLTVAVSAKTSATTTGRSGFYDYPALAAAADHVFVLAWDLHWATSPAGPISDVTWVTKIAAYVATVPNSTRFIIGTQFYGFDWPLGGKAVPYEYDAIAALEASVGAATQWDALAEEPYFTYTDAGGVAHTVYFADAQSVEDRLALARARGLGIGVWRLGTEDQSLWADPSLQP